MFRIQTILHPTDFSAQSAYALETACALARDHDARVVLLHVVPPFIATEAYVPPPPEECRTRAWEDLRRLAEANPKLRQLHVESHIAEGDPAREIARVAEELNADLVVMGTHGRTGILRLLMGSVAEQVLRHAPCPVMTVKVPPVTEPAKQEEPELVEAP